MFNPKIITKLIIASLIGAACNTAMAYYGYVLKVKIVNDDNRVWAVTYTEQDPKIIKGRCILVGNGRMSARGGYAEYEITEDRECQGRSVCSPSGSKCIAVISLCDKEFVLRMDQDIGTWCLKNNARVYAAKGEVNILVDHKYDSCTYSYLLCLPPERGGTGPGFLCTGNHHEHKYDCLGEWCYYAYDGEVTVTILPTSGEATMPNIKTVTITFPTNNPYNLLDAQEAINMIYKNLLIVPASQQDKYQYHVDPKCVENKRCSCSLESDKKNFVCKIELTRSPG
jgi:hypothetical protein